MVLQSIKQALPDFTNWIVIWQHMAIAITAL